MNERAMRLERFRTGYADVASAVADVSDEDLDRRPADGGWTAREVVHHLADMETHGYLRLRRMIVEDEPVLDGPDDIGYALRLHYDRPIATSLTVVRAVREASRELLDALEPGDWKRTAIHPKLSPYDVDEWLRIYAEHAHVHADQIRAAIGRT